MQVKVAVLFQFKVRSVQLKIVQSKFKIRVIADMHPTSNLHLKSRYDHMSVTCQHIGFTLLLYQSMT